MKKLFLFFQFLAIFFMLSCVWRVPSEVQISGEPSKRFAVNIDFSEMFQEMVDDVFDADNDDSDFIIQKCVNAPVYMTFLIQKDLYAGDIPLEEKISGLASMLDILGSFEVSEEISLLGPGDPGAKETLPANNFKNDLEGFKLDTSGVEAFLYVSGSSIVEKLKINIELDSKPLVEIDNFTTPRTSGIDPNSKEYNKAEMPKSDKKIVDAQSLLNTETEQEVNISISLKAGSVIYPKDLDDPKVKIELVMLLPLALTAVDNASIILPGFERMGDFLNSLSKSGMIEELKLGIELDINPFTNGRLVMQNSADKHEIIGLPMNGNVIGADFTEENLKYFSDNIFTPEFIIKFPKETGFKIPKTLKIMNVSMDAKINHTIEF